MQLINFVTAHWVSVVAGVVAAERIAQIVLNLFPNAKANAAYQQVVSALDQAGIKAPPVATNSATASTK